MANTEEKSPDYEAGYKAGYKAGHKKGRNGIKVLSPKAYWIMRKDGWYCSGCSTKNEQKHNDFCCKCGAKMSEEADYENN